jgi:hypothetical protein
MTALNVRGGVREALATPPLRRLEREDFLEAVTGHPRALQAADRVIEARSDG